MNCRKCGEEMFPVRLGGFGTLYICKHCEPEVYEAHFGKKVKSE
jgi:hypothetical protein